MDMPVQDEESMPIQEDFPAESALSNAVTPAKDRMLDEVDDNISIVSSSQEKRRRANFTSPTYRQQEVARCGDADDSLVMSPSAMPKVTPVATLKTTSQVMPRVTPQSSPGRPTLSTSALWGLTRAGTSSSPIGWGRELLPLPDSTTWM